MPSPALRWLALPAALLLGACGSSQPSPASPGASAAKKEIAAMLDDWHDAAARSDEPAYFAHFAPEAIFIGTDPTERWDLEALRKYASPKFSQGKGWTMKPRRRDIFVGPSGDVAWFDEDLTSKGMGALRASGVVARGGSEKRWRVVHYDLSIPVPNSAFDDVRKRIEQDAR